MASIKFQLKILSDSTGNLDQKTISDFQRVNFFFQKPFSDFSIHGYVQNIAVNEFTSQIT